MDWFNWLSKTGLDSSLVYEYGLTFSQNELAQDDIPHFNHEFLQSMGICIAKHRLEILKLARKEKGSNITRPMSRIFVAIKRTKRRFSNYIHTWTCREESALALVPARTYSGRRTMIKRNKRLVVANKPNRAPLLLTNGSPMFFGSARINSFSSPVVHEFQKGTDERMNGDYDHEDEYWSSAVEEVRWDTMFQNLKPT